jgi:hypothetical protein
LPVDLPRPRPQSAQPAGLRLDEQHAAMGPRAGFLAALFAALGAAAISHATLTADHVMPVVATVFLMFAATFGALAWWRGRMDERGLTYRDVAGALTLIGICAAAAIDSEQMIRIAQLQPSSD